LAVDKSIRLVEISGLSHGLNGGPLPDIPAAFAFAASSFNQSGEIRVAREAGE
jgi:hypothetical protein